MNRVFTIILMAVSLILADFSQVKGAEAKYAYTTKSTWVVNAKGKKIVKFPEGITIKYRKLQGNKLQFNYFGRHLYLPLDRMLVDSALDAYVKANSTKFNMQADTLQKAVVYRDTECSKVLRKVSAMTSFKIFKEVSGLYKVQLDGEFGYLPVSCCRKYCVVDVSTFPKIKGNTIADKLVNYAKRFLGNPYVWGGTSLTSGCDCSGFVQSLFKNFGYQLPRCSYEQACEGKAVPFEKMKPGDLIFYYRGSRIGHVTLYIGNGKVIQARGRKYGIVITDWDYSTPAFARRILKN